MTSHKPSQTAPRPRGPRWPFLTALAAVLSLVSTWPAAAFFSSRLYKGLYSVDAGGGIWWPHAFVGAILRGDYPFFSRDLAWPDGQDVTPMIWNYGVALLFSPIYALADPILAANLVALGIVVLNSLAAAWAAKEVVGSGRAEVAAVVVAATSPFAWIEAGSGRQDQALWAPIAVYLACLVVLGQGRGEKRHVWIGALSLAAAGAVYWFYAYFLVVLTFGLAVVLGVAHRRDPEYLENLRGKLTKVLGGAFILVLPFLIPVAVSVASTPGLYRQIAHHVPAVVHQQVAFSMTPACFSGLLGFGRHDGSLQGSLLLVPVLAWTVLGGRGGTRALASLGLAALVFACGPYLANSDGTPVLAFGHWIALPMKFLHVLPGFDRFWWPYRWIAVAIPVFAVSAGWIVSRIRFGGWAVVPLAVFLVVESGVLLRLTPGNGTELWPDQPVPAVFGEMARLPWPSPALQVPLGTPAIRNTVWQAFHKQPIDMGLDWHIPGVMPETYRARLEQVPLLAAVGRAISGQPMDRKDAWRLEETAGFRYVLLPLAEDPEGSVRAGLEAFWGPPDYRDCDVAVWHVPGVASPLRTPSPAGPCRGLESGRRRVSP